MITSASAQTLGPLKQIAMLGDSSFRHREWITSIEPFDHGKQVATTSRDGTVRIWDAVTGKQRRIFLPNDGKADAWHVRALGDGKRLLTCGGDGRVTLWDIESGKVLKQYMHGGTVFRIAIAPDQKTFVAVDSMKAAVQWNIETGKKVHKFNGHTEDVYTVAISPDGKTLATGSEDKTIILWNLETGEKIRELAKCGGDVFTIAFAPDGQSLFSVSGDQIVRRWNLEGTELWQQRLPGIARTVDVSPDGSQLICHAAAGKLLLLDANTGQTVKTIASETSGYPARFSEDGKRVYAALANALGCWQINSGRALRPVAGDGFPPVIGGVTAMAVSRDGSRVVIGDGTNQVHVWDVGKGQRLGVGKLSEEPRSASISADGKLAVVGSREDAIIMNLADGKSVTTLHANSSVDQWFFSGTGRTVIAAYPTRALYFDGGEDWASQEIRWPNRDGSHDWLAAGPSGNVGGAEWNSNTVRIIDLPNAKEIGQIRSGKGVRMFCLGGEGVALLIDNDYQLHQFGRPAAAVIAGDADAEQYRKWVTELSADSYQVREQATDGLIAAGADAKAALAQADLSDPEVAMRVKRIRAGAKFSNVASAEVGQSVELRRYPRDLAMDRSGRRFAATASGDNQHTLYLGRVTRGGLRDIITIDAPKGARQVAFTADGKRLFVGHDDDTIVVYQVPEPATDE